MNHPYTPPEANLYLNENQFETYDPKIFSTQGRIGRLRYVGYSFLVNFVVLFAFSVLVGIFAAVMATAFDSTGIFLMIVLGGGIYLAMFAVSFIYAKRRLNDLNQSGWLSLLLIVPVVNFFFALYLLFAPGSATSNQYGPPPSKNPVWIAIAMILVPIFVIGVLAAIAIPAYHEFQNKAKKANEAAKGRAENPPPIPESLPPYEPQTGGGDAVQPVPSADAGGGAAEPTPQPNNN